MPLNLCHIDSTRIIAIAMHLLSCLAGFLHQCMRAMSLSALYLYLTPHRSVLKKGNIGKAVQQSNNNKYNNILLEILMYNVHITTVAVANDWANPRVGVAMRRVT